MSQALGQYPNFVAASVPVVNAVETVVGTSAPVTSAYAGSVFVVEFALDFLTGAGTTSTVYRIRRTSVTGTADYTSPSIVAAASTQQARQFFATVIGIAGEIASSVWVLTVVQTAGSSNGSATNVFSRVTTV